jgi:hypothetical protein
MNNQLDEFAVSMHPSFAATPVMNLKPNTHSGFVGTFNIYKIIR